VGKSRRFLAGLFQAGVGIHALCGFPYQRHFPSGQGFFESFLPTDFAEDPKNSGPDDWKYALIYDVIAA
jgi:hypothetical protein